MDNKLPGETYKYYVWSSTNSSSKFGAVLIFLSEIYLLQDGCPDFKIIYVGEHISEVFTKTIRAFIKNEIICVKNTKELKVIINDNKSSIWPNDNINLKMCSCNDSTLYFQEIHKRSKVTRGLSFPPRRGRNIKYWINANFENYEIVTVHLKNSNIDFFSNYSPVSWLRFFEYSLNKFEKVRFLLIGADSRPSDEITALPNIYYIGDSLSLEDQIALVHFSRIFIGMSSGPCNAAIFSQTPYVIWKHHEHHKLQMDIELGDAVKFSFSNSNQFFLREIDTFQSIKFYFEKIYQSIMSITHE